LHAVLLAVVLVVLGWGLIRRRLLAMAGMVLFLGSAALGMDHSRWSALLVGYAVGLVLCHASFRTRPDRTNLVSAARFGGLTLVAAGLFAATARMGFAPSLGWSTSLLVVVLVVLLVALRAAPAPQPSGELERARVRWLVSQPGADTLAPFALRSDKTYLFSSDGSAAVGYRVLLGVAVVGGDPVGDPAGYRDVVARFLALCDRRGWRPAVLGARGDLVELWREHGLRSVGIGDEVVLDAIGFSLSTRRMRNVRQAVARTRNAGVVTTVARAGDLTHELRAEMARLSTAWLGSAKERGFSMILDGLFDDRHPDAVFVLAFAEDHRLVGFQRYLDCGSTGPDAALSLDVMRRDRGRINGLNERMIIDMVEYARAHGVGRVSLNFAAFRELLDKGAQRTAVEQTGYRLLHLLDPLIQVESLYLFNAKFRPGYVSRHVALGSWLALPTVLGALLGLEFALPYDLRRDRQSVPAEAGVLVGAEGTDQLPDGAATCK
jgi:lysyl-tRNA synthetase class 2